MPTPPYPVVRAVFDEDGRPTAFYPEPAWTADKVPPEAVEIPYLGYLELLEFQGRRRWDGSAVVACDPQQAGGAAIPPEMLAVMERLGKESNRMHAAIVSVVLSWAGLENALAGLLGGIVPN